MVICVSANFSRRVVRLLCFSVLPLSFWVFDILRLDAGGDTVVPGGPQRPAELDPQAAPLEVCFPFVSFPFASAIRVAGAYTRWQAREAGH